MTWVDITLIVILVLFVALGARMGSLWTGACLIGGFFGAFLVEYYTLPVADMMGNFPASRLLAGTLLFVGGLVIALIPGWALSRLASVVFLGIFDSVVGLLAGLLSGLVFITLLFFWVLPHFSSIERSAAWKKSKLVKPLHHTIEDVFNNKRFRKGSTTDQLKDELMKDVKPVFEETGDKIKTTLKNIKK